MPLSANDHIATSWEHLQGLLFKDTWDGSIGRFRSPFVYRGSRSHLYELDTSLQRLGGHYHELEHHLLRNFRKYARDTTMPAQAASTWDWLALAQHHGLPTRLLDWTYSPYVALHFATDDLDAYHEDGIVWALNYVKAAEHLPARLRQALQQEGSNVFTSELLQPVSSSLRELEVLQAEPYVLFLEPPSLDARIVHQYALFSLMSTAQSVLHDWLADRPELYFRIVIPAKLKWEVRDKLDQANITERVLLPGLGGLSRWLHRHYSPRNNGSPFLDENEMR
ncbi:FRG domain-containing protein [Hymenobacter glacialis]|uniref:FRG domain-containing protein n=1 Tax=Hymenobacter glacialis TaxID=1908236 RepID=A0A1G1ST34_9BACT|nr:FRG domain-containing protein [Hymenobacter glacialis]OGX81788.1 FRG domain-containing protein [Hymenobacter glacialis]